MAPTDSLHCPNCGEDTSHRLVARTRLHIGIKRKWRCVTCEHQHITLNGDTVVAAED